MAIKYLKKSPKTSSTDDSKTTEIVKNLLKEIENSKEEACINLTKKLFNFANTSIDISDGLFADLDKLINKQRLSYKVHLSKIPISKNLKKIILSEKLQKIDFVSKGDDYQILFTASKKKSRIIKKTFKSLGIKISKIGNICSGGQKSQVIDEKGNKIAIKNKGHFHNF